VSLVGAGGIGKTVLAQAAARQARDRFADGVWLVELARLSEPRLIVETLATTLQITLTGEGDPHALARALGDACVLVVVDNCEHVADAAGGVISTLLADAPNLSVLVTSQEPLRLAQENLYRLSPLRVPAEANLESARTAGAVALFEARARTADPRFTLSNDNVAAVIDVCYRLDGIPLAIELAAVRVPVLGVEGLRERLGARFRILTTGARQGLRRHQTLRAALDWSHGLLTRDEQAVFRRIGIFVGGFGLKAAQQVGRDDQIDDWAALEHLGALVEKSLVALDDAHGEPRYRLLETARAYAREKLDESGERERVARAHAQATLEVFEGALYEEHLLTGSARLQKYLPDLEDARAALDWSQQADERLFVALAGAVAWIWVGAGQRLEGVRCNRAAIAKITRDTPAKLAARLLIEWKALAWPEEGTKVVPVSAHALELYRSLGDEQALFAALCRHAECLTVGAPVEADRFLDEAGRIWRSDWPAALRLQFFWVRACALHQQGRCEESLAMLEESIRLAKIIGDARMRAKGQTSLTVALPTSDPDNDVLAFQAVAPTPDATAYQLNQLYAFQPANAAYYFNLTGNNDKWLIGKNNIWYVILPTGKLYRWTLSIAQTLTAANLIASLDPGVYVEPRLLWNANPPTPPALTFLFQGNQLTIQRPASLTGVFFVDVTVSDGLLTAKRTIEVTLN